MFPRYLQYPLTDFRQTCHWCISGRDDLITFLGQKVKVQGHAIAAEVRSTRFCRRVQLLLVISVVNVVVCDLTLLICGLIFDKFSDTACPQLTWASNILIIALSCLIHWCLKPVYLLPLGNVSLTTETSVVSVRIRRAFTAFRLYSSLYQLAAAPNNSEHA